MQLDLLAFAGGVWLLQQQSALPGWGVAYLLGPLALAALALWRRRSRTMGRAGRLFTIAAWALTGFAWAAWMAEARLADALPGEWEGRDILLEGVVASLPQASGRSVRFEFAVERVLTPGAQVPARLLVSWWSDRRSDAASPLLAELRAGERWRLRVRLRRPHGLANPHGFDYEAWLMERRLRATGYVRGGGDARRITAMVHAPGYWIERLRGSLRERVATALPEGAYAGVIAALTVGDQRAIPPEQWQVYTRTGINHLMSISGLHVTMISGLVFALVAALWRRVPALLLRVPAAKAAAAAGLATALGYALLAGFAVPAQRTVCMLAVVAVALWTGMAESGRLVLTVALFVVLLLDPWAVLAAGFWLSFGAVAVIMFVCNGRVGGAPWWSVWLKVQMAVTVALVPVLLAIFQQFSLVSPLANALAIPVVGLVVVPLALLGLVAPVDWLLQGSHLLLGLCMIPLEWLAGLDAAVWEQPAPPAWAALAGGCGALLLLAPRGVPARWVGAAGFIPLIVVQSAAVEPGGVAVTVLDVGHGVAVVVRTAGHALLYDTGPPFGPQADSGTRVILPFLRALGVERLDTMIVSHDDADHSGGALSVLQGLPVGLVLTTLPQTDPVLFLAAQAARCRAGQRWEWDGVLFEILHPDPERPLRSRAKDNDASCVLSIRAPGVRVLLPGDIERASEERLIAQRGGRLAADILLAPHQGSRTSSSAGFVAAVAPRVVVLPVGYRNRFGHPHREVLRRYVGSGASVYRTDRDGAVSFTVSRAGRITVTPWRGVRRRYWQTQMADDPPAPAAVF